MKHFQTAVVVGASSGIGADLVRQLAATGCRVVAIARRQDRLLALVNDYPQQVIAWPIDITTGEDVNQQIAQMAAALGGLDLFIYNAGIMPRVGKDDYPTEDDLATVDVNFSAAIRWINGAALRFSATGAGTIVGVSSVAGDRGRRGGPVYAATKAGLNVYLEALRNRLTVKGVSVVTIKPGPIETAMTAGLGALPLMIPSNIAAKQILMHAGKGTSVAYVPGVWKFIMWIVRAVPQAIFQRLDF